MNAATALRFACQRVTCTLGLALLATASACGAAQPGDEPAAPPVSQSAHALCAPGTYTATFGNIDAYAGGANSDPGPWAPNPAMPAFMSFLANPPNNIPLAQQTGFDNPNFDRKVVATMRHGLGGCFFITCTLKLNFRAKALSNNPGDDVVYLFNTTSTTFPQLTWDYLHNLNGAPWTTGQDKILSLDLTAQMNNGQVGDMLQLLVSDDTMVDYAQLKLTCS